MLARGIACVMAALTLAASPSVFAGSAPLPLLAEVAGATALSATLDRPLTVSATGLQGALDTTAPWAALVLARQDRGSASPQPAYVAGLALVPNGRDRSLVPFGAVGVTLPAGAYALYVLGPGRSRVKARLAASGLRVAGGSRTAVPAGASSSALLASVSALTDRQAFALPGPGAGLIVGATWGQVVGHELAGCLIAGPVPPGVEETCGSPAPPASAAASSAYGYGPVTLSAFAPALGKGAHTGVVRAESLGFGSGVGMTTLHWTWTALT